MALKPRTRKEFLIADFIDKDTPDIVPKTRSEMFLKQMLDKSSKPSWNDLTDKPFGDNEDGTVKTIDPKYLPEGSGGGGFTIVYVEKYDMSYFPYYDANKEREVDFYDLKDMVLTNRVIFFYMETGFYYNAMLFEVSDTSVRVAIYDVSDSGEVIKWLSFNDPNAEEG